uniref:Odorant-binding protein 6 n=1 Tax=Anopheles farauti TaxID=69004 RepID=A0A182QX36_9DIPT
MNPTKRFLILLSIFGCSTMLAAAHDPDCANLRDRRDEMEQCCQVDLIIPLKDAEDCAGSGESSNPFEQMICTFECKLLSLGVLNGDEIVQSKLLEYANRLEEGWKETAINIANNCTEMATNMMAKMKGKVQDAKCSPIGSMLMTCVMKNTFDQCPEGKWQDTTFCNKIRSGECFKRRGD